MDILTVVAKDKSNIEEYTFYIKIDQNHNNNGHRVLNKYNSTQNINIKKYCILKDNDNYVLKICTHISGMIISLPKYDINYIIKPNLHSNDANCIKLLYKKIMDEYSVCLSNINNIINIINDIDNDETIFNFKIEHVNLTNSRLHEKNKLPYGLILSKYENDIETIGKNLRIEKKCKYINENNIHSDIESVKNREIKKILYLHTLQEIKQYLLFNKNDIEICIKNVTDEYNLYNVTSIYDPQYICKNIYGGYFNISFCTNELNSSINRNTTNWKDKYTQIFTIVTNKKKYLYKNENGGIQYTDVLCLVMGNQWNLFPSFNGDITDFNYINIIEMANEEIHNKEIIKNENNTIYLEMSLKYNVTLNEFNCHLDKENYNNLIKKYINEH
ncbi:hypothetical protein BMW23_1039 [Bodo saltans virus]|uniref:Uncharacterized protein n=1 Tax=Bodo saltans virus TaxID=2024608 RepID=A0A2H4UW10_9VIRU|nr:hypothetical protein QJ851_gp1021 [Bodo saltans virus]ATZ81084.1 hypothetical protein BMW23_1039 [Bodo saltans virus]